MGPGPINDVHVHTLGDETATAVLEDMDAAGVDKAVFLRRNWPSAAPAIS